jgi:hypothetical protein
MKECIEESRKESPRLYRSRLGEVNAGSLPFSPPAPKSQLDSIYTPL